MAVSCENIDKEFVRSGEDKLEAQEFILKLESVLIMTSDGCKICRISQVQRHSWTNIIRKIDIDHQVHVWQLSDGIHMASKTNLKLHATILPLRNDDDNIHLTCSIENVVTILVAFAHFGLLTPFPRPNGCTDKYPAGKPTDTDLKIRGSHEYPTIVSTEIFDCFLRDPSTEICLKVNKSSCLYNVIKSEDVSSSQLYNRNKGRAHQANGIREQSVVSAFEGILGSIVRYLLGSTTCYKHHQKDKVIVLFEDHSEKLFDLRYLSYHGQLEIQFLEVELPFLAALNL
ncbi:hypothetical protein AGLY_002276, partial [Aphis glycines]